MGSDSVKPFLAYENKWVILLALTSNEGAFNFQTQRMMHLETQKEIHLYEDVLKTAKQWGSDENMMFVVCRCGRE